MAGWAAKPLPELGFGISADGADAKIPLSSVDARWRDGGSGARRRQAAHAPDGGPVSNVGERGRDLATDLLDNVGATLEENMRTRPFATLAVAVGLGLIVGALWRR